MIKPAAIAVVLSCFLIAFTDRAGLRPFHLTGFAQGTTYHITYYADDSIVSTKQIDSIVSVIDSSLSIYKTNSLITKFNQSDNGIAIDPHLKNVVRESLDTYKQTGGLFDITVLPLMEAWGFGTNKIIPSIPDSIAITRIKSCTGSDKLLLNGDFLSKKKSCVRIDVNGIAQGYTVDVVANFLETKSIYNYLVEIGGEVRAMGRKPGGDKMTVAIEAPPQSEFEVPSIQKIVRLENGALTTSGSYRKYYESGGKRITHLINPLTGYTVSNEPISVTVYAKDATTADAYDNAIMAMGLKEGLRFVNHRTDIAAYFIFHDENANVKDSASAGFQAPMNYY